MTTEKQAAANRRNARKSTGPRTEKGKAVSKRNSVNHGLLARNAVLPGEDAGDLEVLHRRLTEQFAPVGEVELMLVDRVADLTWWLRRAARVETGIYAVLREGVEAQNRSEFYQALGDIPKAPEWIRRHLGHDSADGGGDVDDDAVSESDEDAASEGSMRLLGQSFLHDSGSTDAFGKLSRYEAAMERSFYRALRELDRVQHARKSGEAATPVVVDGTVDEDIETST